MMCTILKLRPMLTAIFSVIHVSRSVTIAFSGNIVRQQRNPSLNVLKRRGCPVSTSISKNSKSLENRPTTKHWLSSQHQSSHSSNDGNSSNAMDDTAILGIPSVEQLRTDSFMKQVKYAEFITGLIEEDNGRETDVLMKRLRAQLSHPDGIRGFMVTYLTTIPTTTTENSNDSIAIPQALTKAIFEQIDPISDKNELISLMCMNVIMPTGMITMQPNEEMSQQSATTAKCTIQLLKTVLNHNVGSSNDENKVRSAITAQCNAILAAATEVTDTNSGSSNSNMEEEKLQTYWRMFFQKWGYQSLQQSDIANAIRTVLSQQP